MYVFGSKILELLACTSVTCVPPSRVMTYPRLHTSKSNTSVPPPTTITTTVSPGLRVRPEALRQGAGLQVGRLPARRAPAPLRGHGPGLSGRTFLYFWGIDMFMFIFMYVYVFLYRYVYMYVCVRSCVLGVYVYICMYFVYVCVHACVFDWSRDVNDRTKRPCV